MYNFLVNRLCLHVQNAIYLHIWKWYAQWNSFFTATLWAATSFTASFQFYCYGLCNISLLFTANFQWPLMTGLTVLVIFNVGNRYQSFVRWIHHYQILIFLVVCTFYLIKFGLLRFWKYRIDQFIVVLVVCVLLLTIKVTRIAIER